MSGLYNIARQRMLKGMFDWENMDVRVYGYSDPNYVFDEDHVVLSHIGAPNTISLSLVDLVATSTGYARGGNAVMVEVPIGITIRFLIMAEVSGDPSLIAYIDEGEGLPFVGMGLDQAIVPDWLQYRGWFRP